MFSIGHDAEHTGAAMNILDDLRAEWIAIRKSLWQDADRPGGDAAPARRRRAHRRPGAARRARDHGASEARCAAAAGANDGDGLPGADDEPRPRLHDR